MSKDVGDILKDHERRIAALESKLSGPKQIAKKDILSLPDHILNLRNNGFFSQPKTIEETHAKLQGVYHCEMNRVLTALRRLAENGKLRKSSKLVDGAKYKAYVW